MNVNCSTIKCSQFSLLIIEDNIAEIKLMQASMRLNGLNKLMHTDIAINAEQALKLLQAAYEQDMPYNLITLDLEMPRIDGKELLSALKNDPRLSDIPVIVISDCHDPANEQECYRRGADMFVRKSMDFHTLIDLYKAVTIAITEDGYISPSGIAQRYMIMRT